MRFGRAWGSDGHFATAPFAPFHLLSEIYSTDKSVIAVSCFLTNLLQFLVKLNGNYFLEIKKP